MSVVAISTVQVRTTAIYIILAAAIFLVGSTVLLPGLDRDALAAHLAALPHSPLAHLSVTFLWASPLFGALALAEIAKLVCPPLARWQASRRENGEKFQIVVRLLALCLSGVQGYGIVTTLSYAGLMSSPQPTMMIVAMASLMGCTAITIWIAERLRMPEGELGIWILLVVPFMFGLVGNATNYIHAISRGTPSAGSWIVLVGFTVASFGMIWAAFSEISRSPSKSVDMLVWPPVLAQVAAGYILAAIILMDPARTQNMNQLRTGALILIGILIPVFAYGYLRRRIANGGSVTMSSERKTFCKVVAVQLVIVMGAATIDMWTQSFLVVNGQLLIAGVTTGLVLLATRSAAVRK